MIQLNETEIQRFELLQSQATRGNYAPIYKELADLLTDKYRVSATDSSVLWLRGATEANAGRGAFSALIRGYTESQYQLRYGTSIPTSPTDKLQDASDAVAKNLLRDLTGGNPLWPRGQMPDIRQIALADATAVGDVLFDKPGDTSASPINSAWSGSLLFSLLRSDQTNRLMQGGGDPGKIDTLNDWRDVLYAFKSYEAGVKATIAGAAATASLAVIGTPLQKAQALATQAVDLTIMGATLYGYASSGSGDLLSAVLAGTPNPTLKEAFKVIGNVGQNKFLDMLMGAVQAKQLLGTTTDANFAATAKAFFGALTPQELQILDAKLLPSSPSNIAALAQTDASVRAALVAGSIVSIKISDALANSDTLRLMNPTTGQGSLSSQWINDRALFVTAIGTGKPDLNWQTFKSSNLPTDRSFEFRYVDASGTEKVIFAENTARPGGVLNPPSPQVIVFGGVGNETLTGSESIKFGDHLYGGAGDDNINGNAGADYLEGNTGNDTLNGGDNDKASDTLIGGQGTDTYQFNGNNGRDFIIDSDGQGSIQIDGATLTGGAQYGDNRVYRSADKKHLYVLANDKTLLINSQIVVQGYDKARGDLGLNYTDAALQTNPRTSLDIKGDFKPLDTNLAAAGIQTTLNDIGNIVTTTTAETGRADTLNDSPGNDHITSGGGSDDIYLSKGGDNWVEAGTGRDWVRGGAGKDLIEGGAGEDILQGGGGDDRLFASSQISVAQAIADGNTQVGSGLLGDYLGGGAGDDAVVGGTANDAIFGGAGSDLLIGGAGDDRIFSDGTWAPLDRNWNMLVSSTSTPFTGGDGDLFGAAESGNDVIYLGNGGDWGMGGGGNDVVFGEAGDDTLNGGGDNDALFGGTGNDIIYGDYVSDALINQGDDYLDGGADADKLYGLGGSDILIGGAGDDQLDGGLGADVYIFNVGDGNDTISDYTSEDNIIRFGEGISESAIKLGLSGIQSNMSIALGNGDSIALGFFDQNDTAGSATISGLEFSGGSSLTLEKLLSRGFDLEGSAQVNNIRGTNITDRIYGFAGNDTLNGNAGDDIIYGGSGDDYLGGDEGNDRLEGEAGNDTLSGGAGNDILLGGLGDDLLLGGAGDDFIDGGAGNNKAVDGDGADRYVLRSGSVLEIEFYDSTAGDAYTDTLEFADAVSSEVSFSKVDSNLLLFVRGAQVATLKNVYSYKLPLAAVTFADGTTWNAATLTTNVYGATPILGAVNGTAGADVIRTGSADDVIYANAGSDSVDAGAGDDTVYGGAGIDTIDAGDGNDYIDGGAGNDAIRAGAGNDTISVASGRDVVDGGSGIDTFVIYAGAEMVITDTGSEVNTIKFADIGVTSRVVATRLLNDLVLTVEPIAIGEVGSTVVIKNFNANPLGFAAWALEVGGTTTNLAAVLPASINPTSGTYERYKLAAATNLGTALLPANFATYNLSRSDPLHPSTVTYEPILATPAEATISSSTSSGLTLEETAIGTSVVQRKQLLRYDTHTQVRDEIDYRYEPTGRYEFYRRQTTSIYDGYFGYSFSYPQGSKLVNGAGYVDIYRPVLDYVPYAYQVTVNVETPVYAYYDETLVSTRTDFKVKEYEVEGTAQDDVITFGSRTSWAGLARLRGGDGDDTITATTSVSMGDEQRSPTYIGAPITAPTAGSGFYLDGGVGQDTLAGSNDADVLNGGTGADILAGGAGGDVYVVSAGDVVADLAVGKSNQSDIMIMPVGVAVNEISVSVVDWLQIGAPATPGLKAVVLTWGANQSVTVVVQSDYLQSGRLGAAARAPIGDEGNPRPGDRPIEFLFDKSAEYIGSIGIEFLEVSGQKIGFADFLRGRGITTLLAANADLNETLIGTAADDVLIGGGGADVLIGGENNDILIGDKLVVGQSYRSSFVTGTLDGPGDTFVGGKGDDQGWLTKGADTIRFNLGDGQDSYLSWETLSYADFYGSLPDAQEVQAFSSDTIVIGGGLTVANMNLVTKTNYVAGSSDRDLLRDSLIFSFKGSADQMVFEQGAILKLQIREEGGVAASKIIVGGKDYSYRDLVGGAGDDFVVSGKFDEVLSGGVGSDVYYIGADSGYDTIIESKSELAADVVKFGASIRAQDLRFATFNDNVSIYFTDGAITLRGGYARQSTIERFEFDDGTVWTHAQLLSKLPLLTNTPPTVGAVLAAQQVTETQSFSYQLPLNTFTDIDVGDQLTLRASLANGDALPEWLVFDSATSLFSGTPPNTASGLLVITVTATDEQGASVTTGFALNVLDSVNVINGTALDDVLVGTVADDAINGDLGADRMAGGKGNDIYYVDNALDKVIEKANEGRDSVYSTVMHTLAANVEDLVLAGTDVIDGTGNSLDNRIDGNSADNKLLGGAGNDILAGGAGDDWLRGGTGADTLVGATGDDLYEVDSAGDTVVEALNEGKDTVEASVTYSLADGVETLILTGTLAVEGTGNALDNNLQGNDAANVLTGGAGNDTLNGKKGLDTLTGGAGNDTYLLEDDVDTIVELAGEGLDAVLSRYSLALAANIEDGMLLGSAVNITGNGLANVLTGNNAANTIDGGAGADVMLGGKGNDTYIVDGQADTLIENAAEGTDTVQSSVNYTLADHIENLTLTGIAEAGMGNSLYNKITGNAASNKLFGGAGNDVIDGGEGADILLGGLGNDTYWVDSSSDLVVEAAAEGTDTVYASVSYALADNAENLILTGSANINAVGNAGNNRLNGNAGNNILFGGLGNDTYVFGRGSGRDIVANFDAGKPSGDKVQLGAGIVDADLNYVREGNDLVLSIKGTTDQLTVAGYFENGGKGAHALEKIRFAGGMSLNHAAVLSRSTVGTGDSAMSDAQSLPAGVRTGNPIALFDTPALAATKTSDASITPQSVAESINAARQRFEQTLKNLKLGTDEQGSLSRSEFAERRALPLLWNLQDALLNLQLAKNADGRFTADVSIDSRATRDINLGISVLGAANSMAGRLDQVARPAVVQQFDLAQLS